MQVPIVSLQNLIPDEVLEEVNAVLKSGYWVDGPNVKDLQNNFANFCGVKYCRAVSNGTVALMSIMNSIGLKPGDEVIVPSFSFIASANCIKSAGAVPVFADIHEDTFNLNIEDVKTKITSKTKAIMPVHLYGLCADMAPFQELCAERDLILLEDAAQAHGSAIGSKKSGSFGLAGGFSLYPTKNMVSGGEGGLITTNDAEIFENVNLFMNHGSSQKYVHTALGYNFRMSEVNGVIAKYALSQLNEWNLQRQKNAALISELLGENENLITPVVPKNFTHIFHQYTLRVQNRQKLVEALQKEKIGYGIHYGIPIHKQEFYHTNGYESISLPITEKIAKEVISLPVYPTLTTEQIHFMCEVINSVK